MRERCATFIDVDAGEQHDADFRRIDSKGAVPALIEPGHPVLTESLAIVSYLDTVVPEPALWPEDARGRARVQSIAATTAADTHPPIVPRIKSNLAHHPSFGTEDWRALRIHGYTTVGLQGLETRLVNDPATGTFCRGDNITVADIFLAAVVVIMRVFDTRVPDIPTV